LETAPAEQALTTLLPGPLAKQGAAACRSRHQFSLSDLPRKMTAPCFRHQSSLR